MVPSGGGGALVSSPATEDDQDGDGDDSSNFVLPIEICYEFAIFAMNTSTSVGL